MNLRRVGRDEPEVGGHVELDGDGLRQRVAEDFHHVLDEVPGLDGDALALDAEREGQDLTHHVGPALGVGLEQFQPLARRVVCGPELEHLDRHQDGREDVVEVVGSAGARRRRGLKTSATRS